jgi:hypothetical protein
MAHFKYLFTTWIQNRRKTSRAFLSGVTEQQKFIFTEKNSSIQETTFQHSKK